MNGETEKQRNQFLTGQVIVWFTQGNNGWFWETALNRKSLLRYGLGSAG
jgi:hypothetical protein